MTTGHSSLGFIISIGIWATILIFAIDRLTAQIKRIADKLDPPQPEPPAPTIAQAKQQMDQRFRQ